VYLQIRARPRQGLENAQFSPATAGLHGHKSVIYRQSAVRGALYVVLAETCFVAMSALVKSATATLPNEIVVFFRNLFGLIALLPLLPGLGVAGLRTDRPALHLLRAAAGLFAMYCFFYSLAHLKLSDAMLMSLAAPIFIPLIARAWLKEPLPAAIGGAVLAGLLGVMFVLKPAGEFRWVLLVALAGSAGAALAKVTIRRLSEREPITRIVFYFALAGTVVSALPLLWVHASLNVPELLVLAGIGILATLGQLLLTRGYASAPAAVAGVFTYSAVILAAGLGWWLWDERWDLASVAGATLIAVAGALALRSSRTPPEQPL
jgi:drug/metabolite transporter (DMT)-like permease